jgi:hypothetical protein
VPALLRATTRDCPYIPSIPKDIFLNRQRRKGRKELKRKTLRSFDKLNVLSSSGQAFARFAVKLVCTDLQLNFAMFCKFVQLL